RRRARAVRARDEQEVAALDIEVETVEHALRAEPFRDAARTDDQNAASASTNAKKTMLMIPFIVKNAALRRRWSCGDTSACSNASSTATAATPSQYATPRCRPSPTSASSTTVRTCINRARSEEHTSELQS